MLICLFADDLERRRLFWKRWRLKVFAELQAFLRRLESAELELWRGRQELGLLRRDRKALFDDLAFSRKKEGLRTQEGRSDWTRSLRERRLGPFLIVQDDGGVVLGLLLAAERARRRWYIIENRLLVDQPLNILYRRQRQVRPPLIVQILRRQLFLGVNLRAHIQIDEAVLRLLPLVEVVPRLLSGAPALSSPEVELRQLQIILAHRGALVLR